MTPPTIKSNFYCVTSSINKKIALCTVAVDYLVNETKYLTKHCMSALLKSKLGKKKGKHNLESKIVRLSEVEKKTEGEMMHEMEHFESSLFRH